MPMPLPEIIPSYPLFLYIPNRVELGFYRGFKSLPFSYLRINLYPKGFSVAFPLGQGTTL